MEEPRRGFEYALLYRVIRKVGTDRLGVEVEGFAAVLLIPIAAVAALERRQSGLLLAGKGEHHLVFPLGSGARSLLQLADKLLQVGGRSHHLVGGRQIGPGGKAEDGGNLLPHREQIKQQRPVSRVSAGVVGAEHAQAQIRAARQRSSPAAYRDSRW